MAKKKDRWTRPSMNLVEARRAVRFAERHAKCGPIHFTCDNSNGIGVSVKVHCHRCNKFRDITDIASW